MAVKTALVVDDSKSARLLLQKTLEKFHIQVESCASVKEALVLLEHKQPDIIFIDYIMSEVNGLEAIPLIKNKSSCSTIPIIICSSQEDIEYRARALAHGAFDFLPKPCSPRYLAHVLQKISPNFPAKTHLPAPNNTAAFNLEESSLDPSMHEAFRKLSQAKKEITHNKLQTLLDERLSHLRRVLLLEIESSVENAIHKTIKQFEQRLDSLVEERITAQMNAIAERLSESTLNSIIGGKFESFKEDLSQLLEASIKDIHATLENSSAPSKKLLTDVKHLARFTASHHAATSAEKIVRESARTIAKTVSNEQLNEVSQKTLEVMTDRLQPRIKLTQRLSMGAIVLSAAALIVMLLTLAQQHN